MRLLFLMILISTFAGCNNSAKLEKPVRDNTINKDTAARDTTMIH